MTGCKPGKIKTRQNTLLEDIRGAMNHPDMTPNGGDKQATARGVAAVCLCVGLGWTQDEASLALGYESQPAVSLAISRTSKKLQSVIEIDPVRFRSAEALCPHCGEFLNEEKEVTVFDVPEARTVPDGFQEVADPTLKTPTTRIGGGA